MKIKLTNIWVDNTDKALGFYTDVLGFVKKADFSQGSYRWLRPRKNRMERSSSSRSPTIPRAPPISRRDFRRDSRPSCSILTT